MGDKGGRPSPDYSFVGLPAVIDCSATADPNLTDTDSYVRSYPFPADSYQFRDTRVGWKVYLRLPEVLFIFRELTLRAKDGKEQDSVARPTIAERETVNGESDNVDLITSMLIAYPFEATLSEKVVQISVAAAE